MEWIQSTVSSLFGGQEATENAQQPEEAADAHLQSSGMLSKGQLLRFFDACRAKLSEPDVKQRLKEVHEAKEDVEDAITELQREMFREHGVDPGWGIHCLARVNTEHRDDADFIAAFYQFVMREEAAVDEAIMPADAFQQKQEMMKRLETQQEAFKARMEGMPPETRQHFLQQQQIIMAQMQQQQAMMGQKMTEMSQEERADYVGQQMDKLEHALQQAAAGMPDSSDTAMTAAEQASFLSGKGDKAS